MDKSATHWNNTRKIRLLCYTEGYNEGRNGKLCPYKFGSYKYKEYICGVNFREGYDDYPEWKCVYRKGTTGYKSYNAGFNKKKSEQ